jgi:hypothetical protein
MLVVLEMLATEHHLLAVMVELELTAVVVVAVQVVEELEHLLLVEVVLMVELVEAAELVAMGLFFFITNS